MFFVHELEQTITIHPSFFGPNIHEHLINKLIHDVEGTNTGSYFIVCIMDQTWQISEGRVIPGSAHAEYTIHYEAVVWKPFKYEVLDGTVSSVIDKGFFVDIGPLSAFVSRSMIPPEIKYDANATPPQWTDNNEQVIEKGTQIRVKIKGVRAEVDRMYAIATIKEDYLGPLPFLGGKREKEEWKNNWIEGWEGDGSDYEKQETRTDSIMAAGTPTTPAEDLPLFELGESPLFEPGDSPLFEPGDSPRFHPGDAPVLMSEDSALVLTAPSPEHWPESKMEGSAGFDMEDSSDCESEAS